MWCLLLVAACGFQPVDSKEQVDFLRLAFKANKDAFTFGTFHFEYTRGQCATLSQAESEFFSKSIHEDGLYVFDGRNERYDLLADAAALATMTTRLTANKASSSARVFRMLTDGEVTLLDRFWLGESDKFSSRSPEIYPGSTTFCSNALFKFPLSLGNCGNISGDLYSDLTSVKDGKGTITEVVFDSRLDGLPVCKLSYTFKTGRCTYWIDVKRGCLPIRIQTHDDQSGLDVFYRFGELEQVAGAGWIPRRRLYIVGSGQIVDRIVVSKIDTTSRPDRSMFQLEFPEAVALNNQAKQLLYSKRKSLELARLA